MDGQLPVFSPCLLWPNSSVDQDATWYGGIGLGQGDFVLDGDPAPPHTHTQRGTAPQFLARVCCGQMAGCIRIPLGTEVGLSPGNIVLHGGPSYP